MNAFKKLTARSLVSIIPLFVLFLFCPTGARAQYLIVDCTGANTSATRASMQHCRMPLPGVSSLS